MRVAIIGAGITGLYLTWKLSENGQKVTVFEKRNKIGKAACSGLISERILEFIPEAQKLVQNQIGSVLIHTPKKTINIKFSKKFFVVSHSELDNLAADLALRAGAEIKLNYDVTMSDVVTFSFDRVVGCDGASSKVRKYLGLPEPKYRLGILGFIPEKNTSNFVETWPINQGFIWRIPRGPETEYGIIAKPTEARKLFDDFCQKNSLQLERVVSSLLPQGLIISRDSKITLCGDATGLTKPWSGGGVIWGLTAAKMLLDNFPDFLAYRNKMKNFFYPQIIFSKTVTKLFYFLNSKTPWIVPKSLKVDGDFLKL